MPFFNMEVLKYRPTTHVRRWTLEGARANFFLTEEELRAFHSEGGHRPPLEMQGAGPGAQQLLWRR